MPQLPESVTIRTSAKEPTSLHIDGAEFPWRISEAGVTISYPQRGIAEIQIGILVDADRINFKAEA